MRRRISGFILFTICVMLVGYIGIWGGREVLHQWGALTFFPGLTYLDNKQKGSDYTGWIVEQLFPLYHYVNQNAPKATKVEDSLTYEMLLAEQAKDEERISEDLTQTQTQPESTQTAQVSNLDMSIEKLRDYNYLISKFYTVDSTTTINASQLNVDDLLSRNMKINTSSNGPKVLVFHTHSQEAFADSKSGDTSTSIVGMGKYLSEQLNALGIETLHHAGVYDLINGKLDRSKAYQQAEVGVKNILNQYPSIEVVIDLHRDGVPESTHLVTEIGGKKVAKIMYFNGLCRTKSNGNLTSMPNPYIQDNLAFSLQMQLESEKQFSGFTRRIYLKGYRYNMHLMPKMLLIEAGAQTNTVEEVKNAMDLLAKILSKVLL